MDQRVEIAALVCQVKHLQVLHIRHEEEPRELNPLLVEEVLQAFLQFLELLTEGQDLALHAWLRDLG